MCGHLLGISRNAKFRERHNQKMRPTHLYPILIHPNVSYLPPPHPSMVISVISMVISVGISVFPVTPYRGFFRHIVILCPTIEHNKTYKQCPWLWMDPEVYVLDPGEHLHDYLRAFYLVFKGEPTLFIIIRAYRRPWERPVCRAHA